VAVSDSRRPLRVTHVITRLIIGGAQENTIASVLGLRGKPSLELHLISGPTSGPEGSLESALDAAPGVLTLLPRLVRPIHPWNDALAFRQLTARLRAQSPDLVHTHSGKAGILGRLAARRARVPIIVHTIHGPSFGPFQGATSNWIFRSAERHAARATHQFISVAEAMTQQYLAAKVGRKDQFVRIRSGFSLEPFLSAKNDASLRARWGLSRADFVIGTIARLAPLKGHDELLSIAAALVKRCPAAKFLLVGGGPWHERLRQKAAALGVNENCVFTGLVQPFQIPGLTGIMDALVHLSRREGLARALPQALAAARPIVAYDCDGANEVCLQNETGFLVKPGDLGELTQRLAQLANDSPLRERLGQRGQQLVREWFPVERMVDELDALYQQLAKRFLAEADPASRRTT
jgi:glycosyltransferase involved in cell wall biosynthesis